MLTVPDGAALAGLTVTLTGTEALPPLPSVTVAVKVSVPSAGLDPAALWRAVAVGV